MHKQEVTTYAYSWCKCDGWYQTMLVLKDELIEAEWHIYASPN